MPIHILPLSTNGGTSRDVGNQVMNGPSVLNQMFV